MKESNLRNRATSHDRPKDSNELRQLPLVESAAHERRWARELTQEQPMLDEVFKYKIGDRLAIQAAITTFGWAGANLLAVVERHLQECEGGVQRTYLVRALDHAAWNCPHSFAGREMNGFYQFKESELIPFDDEAYRAAMKR